MQTVVVIPSRYGSSRFPGKPLEAVHGRTLIERVHSIAVAARGVDLVLVATDDDRIAEHVRSFGGKAVMTSESCRNGSERVFQALSEAGLKPEIVINLQGDAVLTPPWVVAAVVETLQDDSSVDVATPCVRLTWEEYDAHRARRVRGIVGGTTVVRSRRGDALYFSKELLPVVRVEDRGAPCPVFRHIGLYGYRYSALARYLELTPTELEACEGLEQLRLLEHGIPIRCVEVSYRGRSHASIDNPEDVTKVEGIIDHEGEF
ncbi:MAG: 3-deoxy-manno-octulosonate cytidylyltransferase [Planctomycetes bacterium]|nr:3-deoxy-manno-octulosonate cytidylyltransferase [Planctomycetota bacterium]MCB9891879.1 3-deoxy-manno-octulosonate cytidylyltransferase [Planctomycetota bacterium]MCB9919860.1 3-deoxy-manno-octulosonate cytidylyltransferase [Planctomycetota bacterium]